MIILVIIITMIMIIIMIIIIIIMMILIVGRGAPRSAAAPSGPQDASKGGAVETGCSDL